MSYTVHGGESFQGLGCGGGCACQACKSRQAGYGETYTRDEDDDEPEPAGTDGYGDAGVGGYMYGFSPGIAEGYAPGASAGAFGQAPKLKLACRKSTIFSNFIVGDYRLRPPHYERLQQLAALMKALTSSRVVVLVEGHTDSSGADLMNRGLSQSRAHEVVNFLRQSGVKLRVIVIPRGEKLPRASNATAAGRAQNRRVEVRLCELPPPPPPPPIQA